MNPVFTHASICFHVPFDEIRYFTVRGFTGHWNLFGMAMFENSERFNDAFHMFPDYSHWMLMICNQCQHDSNYEANYENNYVHVN